MHYPVRIKRYQLRGHSGGEGLIKGGDGITREYEFLAPTQVTLLTERRLLPPWGAHGGRAGRVGVNTLNNKVLPAKVSFKVKAGDRVCMQTPGGGGWGESGGF